MTSAQSTAASVTVSIIPCRSNALFKSDHRPAIKFTYVMP
jgi:hypothetical protein